MSMNRALLGVVASALLSVTAHGATTDTIATVVSIYTYTQLGNGDVALQVSAPAPGCGGYWFKATDPGFKATFSALLSAYHAGSRVRIGGDDADLWPSSGSAYCRLTFAAVLPG